MVAEMRCLSRWGEDKECASRGGGTAHRAVSPTCPPWPAGRRRKATESPIRRTGTDRASVVQEERGSRLPVDRLRRAGFKNNNGGGTTETAEATEAGRGRAGLRGNSSSRTGKTAGVGGEKKCPCGTTVESEGRSPGGANIPLHACCYRLTTEVHPDSQTSSITEPPKRS